MSQKHKRGENRVVDVDEKKETLITWLFSWYKMVISKMFKFRNKNTYNDYMKSVIRGFWCLRYKIALKLSCVSERLQKCVPKF